MEEGKVVRLVNENGDVVYIHSSPTHGYIVNSVSRGSFEWIPPEVIPDIPDSDLDVDRPMSVDE